MIFSIYKCTNKNDQKSYIGYTGKTLVRRMTQHKHQYTKTKTHFYSALLKYGWDSFEWEIIYKTQDKDHALEMEKFFISQYDTITNGYNICKGGISGPVLFGQDNGMWGKTHTKEVKTKLAQQAKENFSGKSYETIYGAEKADQLKKSRKTHMKAHRAQNPIIGKYNPNYNPSIYTFIHTNGRKVSCTLSEFKQTQSIKPSTASEIMSGKTRKGWVLVA